MTQTKTQAKPTATLRPIAELAAMIDRVGR